MNDPLVNIPPKNASLVTPGEAEEVETGLLADGYRALGRAPESPPALDARILAMARVQADGNAQLARKKALRKNFWAYGFSALLVGALGVAVLVMLPPPSALPDPERASALEPASVGDITSSPRSLPEVQMPQRAPASTQPNDPCRLRVDADTATAEALAEERERLAAQGCDASMAHLPAQPDVNSR